MPAAQLTVNFRLFCAMFDCACAERCVAWFMWTTSPRPVSHFTGGNTRGWHRRQDLLLLLLSFFPRSTFPVYFPYIALYFMKQEVATRLAVTVMSDISLMLLMREQVMAYYPLHFVSSAIFAPMFIWAERTFNATWKMIESRKTRPKGERFFVCMFDILASAVEVITGSFCYVPRCRQENFLPLVQTFPMFFHNLPKYKQDPLPLLTFSFMTASSYDMNRQSALLCSEMF